MNEGMNQKSRTINPNSGNYERNLSKQSVNSKTPYSFHIFGMRDLIRIGQDSLQKSEEGVVFIEPSFFWDNPDLLSKPETREVLTKLRDQIVAKSKSSRYTVAVQEFFAESLQNPELRSKILASLQKNKMPGSVDMEISRAMEIIPDDLFLKMVSVHFVNYQYKVENFRDREKSMRKNWLKKFDSLIKDGTLDLELSFIAAKLDKIYVHLMDGLEQELNESYGEFLSDKSLVNIAAQMGSDMSEEEIYSHELIHAVSGTTAVLWGTEHSDIDPGGLVKKEGRVVHTRIGLSFVEHKLNRLFWLNEAITQDLTFKMLSVENNLFYPREIVLMKELLKGIKFPISQKFFYDAYFEDTTHGEVTESPAMKVLLQAIDESYGSNNFLIRLDDYVSKFGVEKALEALKTNLLVI